MFSYKELDDYILNKQNFEDNCGKKCINIKYENLINGDKITNINKILFSRSKGYR